MNIKFIMASLCWCSVFYAQVNIEPIRSKLKDKENFSVDLSLSMKVRKGNDDKTEPEASVLAGYKYNNHLLFLNASGSYEKDDGILEDREAFAHLRYNLQFYSWLWGETFAQIEIDENRRIQQRKLYGIGPRFGVEWKGFGGFYGSSYMFEQNDISDEASKSMHRWNNYTSLILNIHDNIAASNTTYYQPNFENFKDYRVLSIIKLDIKATDIVGAQFATTIRYESYVPTEVRKLDIEYVNSLVLMF